MWHELIHHTVLTLLIGHMTHSDPTRLSEGGM